ncbi:MAG TPA: type II toxin-antitoxin system VapB family antitoxin [Aestuariivirga sp.]|nr:type II toxin-antitoxin system VapB family antitoxin [Aestuariivirga sp.]
MTFYVKDPATDKAVRRLAKLKGKTLTDTIREAVTNEYKREREGKSLDERLDEIAQRFAQYPDSGLKADKAFFDELSGDI